ncbi:hypothetical protein [Desulfocurvus sp. DL9XJH121]
MQSDFIVKTVLQCEKCGEVFSDSYEQCPKCGSRRFEGYTVVNPIARLPMESILRLCGHLLWIAGTVACILFLWNTNTPDTTRNWWFAVAGFGVLGLSVIMAIALFALGEMLKRIIRIQRRLRAIMDEYSSQGG